MFSSIALSATCLVSACFHTAPNENGAQHHVDIAIESVTVIDVEKGLAAPNQTILVDNGKIDLVGASNMAISYEADRIVNGTGLFAIPGLWDMHAHVGDDQQSRRTLLPLQIAYGVTGIRAMAADCYAPKEPNCGAGESIPSIHDVNSWRADIQKGELVGPQIIAGSLYVNGPSHDSESSMLSPGNATDGRALARFVEARGVDFLKVYEKIPPDAYFAMANEANRLGLQFAGHVPERVRASEASNAGQRSIEHSTGIFEECSSEEKSLRPNLDYSNWVSHMDVYLEMVRTFDASKCAYVFETFRQNDTWVVPTLMIYRRGPHTAKPWRNWQDDDAVRFLPPNEIQYIAAEEGFFIDAMGGWEELYPWHQAMFELTKRLEAADVRLLAGSDCLSLAIVCGIGLHRELELLVEAGLSPAQALRAATSSPAEFMGRTDEVGRIVPAAIADIVLLQENPLLDIANTQMIESVIYRGRYLDRDALDSILEEVETEALSYPDQQSH